MADMALGPARPLFDQRWVDRLSPSVEGSMVATVQFYDPETGTSVYDPETGTYTSTPTVLYAGKARVQPIRSALDKSNGGNDTTLQTVLVSIPISAGKTLDLRPWHRGRVTLSPLNPTLVNFVYVVKEVLDSSNPLERTFHFTVDQEATNG